MSKTSVSPLPIPASAGELRQEASPRATLLPERALLAVSGADAPGFLHSLLTANIETLAPGQAKAAALLTPQGKIIAEMIIANASDSEPLFLIDLRAGFAEDLAARLERYRLRAKVEIARLGREIGVMALLDAPATTGEAFYSFADPRHHALGQRLYGPVEALRAACSGLGTASPADYHRLRLERGIPEAGSDYLPLDTFAHEALLDQFGGIDFKKGCYIGQEIVSRMEHRGTARARALPLRFLNGFGVLGGVEILAGSRPLGRTGEAVGDRAIGIIRLDRLAEAYASGEPIVAGGVELAISTPDFVRFAVPEPKR